MMMKRLLILSLLVMLVNSCKDDDQIENPFLPDITVDLRLNLNLPQYSKLKFPGNSEVVDTEGIGIRGIVVYSINETLFTAYDLSDPNHSPNSCSKQIIEGTTVTCPCDDDDNSYTIISGQPLTGGGSYGLKAYRVRLEGNTLFISN